MDLAEAPHAAEGRVDSAVLDLNPTADVDVRTRFLVVGRDEVPDIVRFLSAF
jgi:hypothetical protein